MKPCVLATVLLTGCCDPLPEPYDLASLVALLDMRAPDFANADGSARDLAKSCVSSCAGKSCGDDGCGGSCGTCAGACKAGQCLTHACIQPTETCKQNSDCGTANQVCVSQPIYSCFAATRRGALTPANANSDCGMPVSICVAGICQGCATNADCGGGFVCVEVDAYNACNVPADCPGAIGEHLCI
jgi:hypothetical protein